jgi:hypothetical protein
MEHCLYSELNCLQELTSYEIDTHSIVVNQLLFPKSSKPPPDSKRDCTILTTDVLRF